MNKVKRSIALLLVLCLAFLMTACGGKPEAKLYGTWALSYDLMNTVMEEFDETYAEFEEPLIAELVMTFGEDGKFEMTINKEPFMRNFDNWVEKFIEYTVDLMYQEFSNAGVTKEEADLLMEKELGMPMLDYLRGEMESAFELGQIIDEATSRGTYEVKGNKLFIQLEDDTLENATYELFAVEGDKLTISLEEGAEAEELVPGLFYPLEFFKIK